MSICFLHADADVYLGGAARVSSTRPASESVGTQPSTSWGCLNGMKGRKVPTRYGSNAADTPEDLKTLERLLQWFKA
jgi:hypothetical protein